MTETAPTAGCLITLKSGEQLRLALSAGYVKMIRRTRGTLAITSEKGDKRLIPGYDIKQIIAVGHIRFQPA